MNAWWEGGREGGGREGGREEADSQRGGRHTGLGSVRQMYVPILWFCSRSHSIQPAKDQKTETAWHNSTQLHSTQHNTMHNATQLDTTQHNLYIPRTSKLLRQLSWINSKQLSI